MRTGSVNKQMPPVAPSRASSSASQPYVQNFQPSTLPAAKPRQTAAELIPARSNHKFTNPFGTLSRNVDESSFRNLLFGTLAFFTLFLIIALTKLYTDNQRYKTNATVNFQTESATKAKTAARILDAEIAWMGTGLSLQGSPQQIINFVARGRQTVAAALIDNTGTVIAATPQAAEPLSSIDRRNFPKGGIQVSSLIGKDGTITPVITQRAQGAFLIMALKPGSLLSDPTSDAAIILDGGRVIDGSKELGIAGTRAYFSLSGGRLNGLTRSSSPSEIISHKANGQNVWMSSSRIPNSSLTVLARHPREVSSELKNNLMIFALLFAGTAWLIWVLMRNMIHQIDILQEQKTADEVSQQRYRAAIDGSRGGVWEIDLGRNQAYISRSLASLLGLPDKEHTLTMPQFLGLFGENSRNSLLSLVRRAHVNGDFDIDVQAAHLPISLACRGRPSVRGSDQAKVIIGMALDVTETRGAQIRLQAAEARLHDALHGMNDSFVIWDQLDRLVLWNKKFEDFFGFQAGNLQQGLDHATIEYHANNAIENTFPVEGGLGQEIQLKDGRWIRYLETSTADGGRVSIGTEITAIRTREYQLQTNQEALEKTINVLKKSQVRIVELAENYEQEKIRAEDANQSKSEFLANMSHELRTPLNAINGFSDIMKKELFGPLGDPRYKEYVNDILFSGQHLLSLINDILDMSKIEAGKMTLNVEAMQMNDMITQVIRILRGRADENRLKLHFNEIQLPEIEADPRAVKQILLNLATNAIKFTPEGGAVTIDVEPKSAGLIIRVSDTGIGISEEDIKRLAQPFEQIDSQYSRQHEGTGLGLALSKSLVELHGGNFSITSVLGEGSTVTFTLPNKPIETKTKTQDDEVGNEISRLAQDIADVLTEGEIGMAQIIPEPLAPQVTPSQPHAVQEFIPHAPPKQSAPPISADQKNPAA